MELNDESSFPLLSELKASLLFLSKTPLFLIGLVPKTKGADGGNDCRQIFKKNTIVF